MRTLRKAIFFDRDGTLIEDKVYLNDPSQIVYMPGLIESLTVLRDLGFIFFVVTNQSGMARGLVDIHNLDEIHRRIREKLASSGLEIQAFYYAPFLVDSLHFARKPNPGMLYYAHSDFGVDFKKSWIVGDRMTDVDAGHSVGCQSYFLKTGDENPQLREKPFFIAKNLLEVAFGIRDFEREHQSHL